jgi:hypothetical protein
MCSFGLVGVSQAFSVSDFSADWKYMANAYCVISTNALIAVGSFCANAGIVPSAGGQFSLFV